QINQVDEKKIQEALGLHFENDEEFQVWAESPGNLEVLCANHHRAHYGIHVIPGPLREALRFHKTGTGPAAEFVAADDLKDSKMLAEVMSPFSRMTAMPRRSRSTAATSTLMAAWNISVTVWPISSGKSFW